MILERIDEEDERYWLQQVNTYIEKRAKEERQAEGGLSALRASNSGIAIECPRQLGYKLLNTPPDRELDARAIRVFRTGNMEEEAHVQDLTEAKVGLEDCQLEFQLDLGHQDYYVTGHIDGTLPIPGDDDKRAVWELKTASPFEAKRWQHLDPSMRTIAQVNTNAFGIDVEDIVLEVIDKASQLHVMLMGQRDIVLWDQTKAGFLAAILGAYDHGTNRCDRGLAPKETKTKSDGELPWQCGYCAYVRQCWSNCGVEQIGKNKHAFRIKTMKDIPERE